MTPKRRTPDRNRGRALARSLALLAASLALLLQVFVIQTHTHVQPPLGSWMIADVVHNADDGHNHTQAGLAHEQGGCIICAVHATSGAATLADAVALLSAHNAAYETAALAIRRAPLAITHSWQSRAPPLAL